MFSIGEFSRFSHVSARMLRHYDKLGLLSPALVGEENGYRYYTHEQLGDLVQIETLKSYGFSLAQIKELLTLPKEELAQKIHERRIQAYTELNDMRRKIRRMEDSIIQMEGTSMAVNHYHVILMQEPEQRIFGIRKTINIAQIHDLFFELHEEMERRGIKRAGATQLLYHGKEFSYDSMDAEAQAIVTGDGEGVFTMPACTVVAVTHTGPYDRIHYAYDTLCQWVSEHPDYEICGPAIERYIKDENMVSDPEELETGVMFPVRKKA